MPRRELLEEMPGMRAKVLLAALGRAQSNLSVQTALLATVQQLRKGMID